MAIIELGNVYSTIADISPKGAMAVDQALSVDTPGCKFTSMYKSGRWDGKTRFYKVGKKGNKFPTGLLTRVATALASVKEHLEIIDKREKLDYVLPDEIQLLHKELWSITLRDYQYEAVADSLKATRGIINVATNGGKTEIAAGIMQCILPDLPKDTRVAFFTASKEIFSQTKKRLEERLGTKIGSIGDGKWEEEQITVVMIPTLAKYMTKPKKLTASKKLKTMEETARILKCEGRDEEAKVAYVEFKAYEKEQWTKIEENVKKTKKFMESVYALIADEAHHSSSDTWYELFMKLDNAYYRFGLTGTVDENNEINVMRLQGCTGRIVSKVSNKFLIESGYSAKPVVYMMAIDTKALTNLQYPDARKLGILHNKVRNCTFVDKVVERANFGKQCLIIVNETEHGELLLDMLKQRVEGVLFTHGQCSTKHRDECLDKLKDGSIEVLIATSILDEGVDVSGINCLFLAAGGKSMRQLLQRIGRGLRKKSDGSGIEVYDALDYHNEYLVEHTLERYNTYISEEFEVIKI